MGIGLTWGALWAATFAAISVIVWVIKPEVIDAAEGPIRVGAIGGGLGLVSGVGFSILLSFAESGRAIRDIAPSRAAIWGVLASAVFPLLTGRQDQVFVLCPIGAAVAVAVVAIARRAELGGSGQPTRVLDVIFGYVHRSVRDAINPRAEAS